ncbi:MAG: hypothetical protein R3B90_15320 [Planctomycetaceae bacterium]
MCMLPMRVAGQTPCLTAGNAQLERFFADEVWPKVGATECQKCHKQAGDAGDTRLVLQDPHRLPESDRAAAMRRNRDAFIRVALQKTNNGPLLLVKVRGGLDHGGDAVFAEGSTGYRILEDFVRQATSPGVAVPGPSLTDSNAPPFFEGVAMLDNRRLLRRATLSLAGRLPTESELAAVAHGGLDAVPRVLDDVMREDAFYDRLREGFNDIFLTLGIDGNADSTVLSYEHFEKTRLWYQHHDFSHIADEKERQQAKYKLANDYRSALLGEPMRVDRAHCP